MVMLRMMLPMLVMTIGVRASRGVPECVAFATTGSSAPPTAKRFAYLVMGPQLGQNGDGTPKLPSNLAENLDRDVFFLAWKEPIPAALVEDDRLIYAPKTSWAEGRNILLAAAVQRAARMEGAGYDYYIFTDVSARD